jgi:hypothetical protein
MSLPIPISNLGLGLSKEQISDKMIQFSLSILIPLMLVYALILHTSTGKMQPMEIFKINYVYSYGDTGFIVISHTGLEDVTFSRCIRN